MPAEKPPPTLADYVTIVLSPVLIMAMIVSLVFFLLALFYSGDFTSRFHYVLFFFVVGMVLVARISMEAGLSDRAPIYGTVLAVLVWFALGKFVAYSSEFSASSWFINAGVIGLAWWLSYQLTQSCTYIDENADNTGSSVLEGAGLEEKTSEALKTSEAAREEKRDRKRASQITWWQRYQRFRAERKKTQPPGVWVVYFGLGALPIFGLGQALIDVGDTDRRAYTFWLMVLYVGSSLGLLVTTAFLGLRRYLRQRGIEMPKLVTTAWLSLGATLLLGLLAVGAIMPRPQAEFGPLRFAKVSSKDRGASKHALTPGDAGKGKDKGKFDRKEHDPNADKDGDKNKSRPGENGKDDAKGGGASDGKDDAGKNAGGKDGDHGNAGGAKKDDANNQDKAAEAKDAPRDGQQAPPDNPAASTFGWLAKAVTVVKWIVFAVIALATVLFILRGGLRYLANFTDWARRLLEALRAFWQRLFAGRQADTTSDNGPAEVAQPRRVPFDDFANPFQDGRAETMTPAALATYSFEALEAWAADRACGRDAHETPAEFTDRLEDAEPSLDDHARRLGSLYSHILYARGGYPPEWRRTLEDLWKQLDGTLATTSER